jgi:large subunit ribosomal protein L4
MPKLTVYNLKREEVGEIELATRSSAFDVKEHLFYEVVKAQLASRRAGTKATKERSAVAGSKKKLYKQKGTGRARQGSSARRTTSRAAGHTRSSPRDYGYRPPRQVRVGALRQRPVALRERENRLIVVDAFELEAIKTKAVASTLGAQRASKKVLVVDAKGNENLALERATSPTHLPPPRGRQRLRPPPARHTWSCRRTPRSRPSRRAASSGRPELKSEREETWPCYSEHHQAAHHSSRRRPPTREGDNKVIFEVARDEQQDRRSERRSRLFGVRSST